MHLAATVVVETEIAYLFGFTSYLVEFSQGHSLEMTCFS
jgi:hypothetical protein